MTAAKRPSLPHRARRVIGGCALFVLAGCGAATAPQWENPDRPVEQWSADMRACRAMANREADRQYRRDSGISSDRGELGADRLSARLDALDAERERNRLLESCLGQLGYRRAGTGKR